MSRARGQLSIAQTVLLLLLGMGLLYGGVMLGAVIRTAAHGVPFEEGLEQVMSEPLGLGLAQLIALGTVLLVGTRLAHGDRSLREALRIRAVPLSVAVLAAIGGLALHFPLVELMNVLAEQIPWLALDEEVVRRLEELTRIDTPLRAIGALVAVVVVAASTEELVFRGLLLPALRPSLGAAGAVLLTSVLFGIFHGAPFVAVYASIAGLVLGTIAVRTGSVLPCIAFHGAFNAVPLLLPEELVAIEGFNVAEGAAHMPPALVLGALAIGATALALLFRIAPREPADEG